MNIMPEYFTRENLALPVMQLSNVNGEELKNLITKRKKNIKIGQPIPTELIGNFSSRGPSQGSWLIKPDIVAPAYKLLVPYHEVAMNLITEQVWLLRK